MDVIRSIFTYIGIVSVAGIFAILVVGFKEWFKEKIADRKWKYKYEHRFDKPPLAQCYCHDCYNYDPKTSKCLYLPAGLHVRDTMFCGEAIPRKHDPELEKSNDESSSIL